MFFLGAAGGSLSSVISALMLTGIILLGIAMTFAGSKLLSKTILKGMPSSFTMELPPYRKPEVAKVIVRSIFDRTLFVLGRAVVTAMPAGLLIWLMANTTIAGRSILQACAGALDPVGRFLGLDGVILIAFILGIPANEIVLPIIMMAYLSQGTLMEFNSLSSLRALLVEHGWTWVTALNTMLFMLMHWPCATTLLTIRKETGSTKWTLLALALPTVFGVAVCMTVQFIFGG